MKKQGYLLMGVLLLLSFVGMAIAEAPEVTIEGTYEYEENPDYAIVLRDNDARITLGQNFFGCESSIEDDGMLVLTSNGDFCRIDLCAHLQEDTLLVSGDIILFNANGSASDLSLKDLDNSVFIKRIPIALTEIAGTSWTATQLLRFDGIAFDAQGNTGEAGDWFNGFYPFTYTLEEDHLLLVFEDDELGTAMGVMEGDQFVLTSGGGKGFYEQVEALFYP